MFVIQDFTGFGQVNGFLGFDSPGNFQAHIQIATHNSGFRRTKGLFGKTAKLLEQLILEDIRRQIDFVTNDDKARAKYLARKQGNIALVMAEDNKRKREIEKRLDDLGKLMQKIYEDRVLGNMPDKACAELLEQYQQEKEDLQAELNELRKRFDGYKREEEDVDEFIRRLKSYAGAEELTRQMCLELIEYVTIDKYVDMKTQRDIHIYYKLIDKPLRDKTNALA